MQNPAQKVGLLQESGATYFNFQTAVHSKLFEERYFGQVLNVTHQLLPILDTTSWVNSLGDIYIPSISCSDISRIRAALGNDWKFGFPLIHTLSDPQNCPDEPLGPDFPSTDGSHTDVIPTALAHASGTAISGETTSGTAALNMPAAAVNGVSATAPTTSPVNAPSAASVISNFSASQFSTFKMTIGFPSLEGPDSP
jgi:hypothetical protein